MCRSARFPPKSGQRCSPRITPMTWALALTTMQATFFSRMRPWSTDFSRWPTKKRDWHDFFDTEKDEFSIARDSSGFIIAHSKPNWCGDLMQYQSALLHLKSHHDRCLGFIPVAMDTSDHKAQERGELVSRFLTRSPSSLICFCSCVMVSISLPVQHFA